MGPAAVDTGPQRKKNESIRSVQPKCTKYRQEQVTYEAWSCANQHREWNLSYVCMNHSWMRPFLQPLRPDLRVTQHCCGTLLYVFDTANVEHSLQTLAYEIGLIYLIYMSVHKRFAFLREGLRVCVYPALYFHAGNLLQFKSKMESQWQSATDLSTDLCQAVLRVTSLLKLVHTAAREHPWDHSGLQSCVH